MAQQTAPPVPPPPTVPQPTQASGKKAVWKRWWFWVIVLLVVAVVAASSGERAPAPGHEPSSAPPEFAAVVPAVRGGTVKQATRAFKGLSVDVRVVVRDKFSSKPSGTVLTQSPAPGEALSAGDVVELTVARPLPRVPDVVGLRVGAARAALRGEGFRVEVSRIMSDAAKDTVVSQSPSGGSRIHPDRIVTLKVAKPAPAPSTGGGSCTSGYSPCLPPASDYDCAGGSGDGPEYVSGTVTVTGSDPYDLDADGDGYGCE